MKTKRWIAFLLALCMALLLVGCSDEEWEEPAETTEPPRSMAGDNSQGESWAIYWYLCGSDLESEYQAATSDLMEMEQVALPENVTVVIETGGSYEWAHPEVDAGQLGRYVYSGDTLEMVDALPNANMGAPETLEDFLRFCGENYPADRTMLIFWNHGGGSLAGVAFDETYDNDSLSLPEIYSAIASACTLSREDPPFDVVGFDACLMATVDTAYMLEDCARYLIASEETEPGCGWNYSQWLYALGCQPTMNGAELGRVICDSYAAGCEEIDQADEMTLSVVDLQNIQPLLDAYETLGREALTKAAADGRFFAKLGRGAGRAENYGGNTDDQGYTDMVDLGDFVRNNLELFDGNAQTLLQALDECVVYKVNGPYRDGATGLSCYYPYSADRENADIYADLGTSPSVGYLYEYALSGSLSQAGMDYMAQVGETVANAVQVESAGDQGLEDHPLYVDEDGNAVLDIGADAASLLQGVYFDLYYVDEENDSILMLGYDNDIDADWDNGVFRDNFRGVWGCLDGALCYTELIYEGEDYNLYSIPILLNGEKYQMRVAYQYDDGAFRILGARQGIEDSGMADRNLRELQPGDRVTLLHYMMTISGDDTEPELYEGETVTVTKDTAFAEQDLGDGTFALCFEMTDQTGESFLSELAWFTVEDGTIYTSA